MKIDLYNGGITLEYDTNGISTISDMLHIETPKTVSDHEYNSCLDGITALILACASQGVNIDLLFQDAVKTAVDKCLDEK